MPDPTVRWTAVSLLLLLAIAGCTPEAVATPSPSPTVRPASASPGLSVPAAPESPVEGLVTAIDGSGDDIEGFTIETVDGQTWTFRVGELTNGDVFPPSHLQAHQDDEYPVLVTFHVEGDELVATHLDDGTPPS